MNEKINCIYNKKSNIINILVEEKTKYEDLSKQLILKISEYCEKNQIYGIMITISKQNNEYVKIIQSMLTIGFTYYFNQKFNKIGENTYKILFMNLNKESNEIEEISFV